VFFITNLIIAIYHGEIMSHPIPPTSSQTEFYWTQLPKVVIAHATFQKAISGEPSESALAYPIQAYLGVKARLLNIVTEEDHPRAKAQEKLGRPLQVDFVGINKRKKWSWALETKLFDGSKRSRVVKDIVKLLILANHSQTANVGRYILLLFPAKSKNSLAFDENAATATHMISTTGETPVNLFDVLLPWTTPTKFVARDKLPSQLRDEFERARSEFNEPLVRDSFRIRLIAKDWSDDFVCGLWKILL
jgi:hypothetical protein